MLLLVRPCYTAIEVYIFHSNLQVNSTYSNTKPVFSWYADVLELTGWCVMLTQSYSAAISGVQHGDCRRTGIQKKNCRL